MDVVQLGRGLLDESQDTLPAIGLSKDWSVAHVPTRHAEIEKGANVPKRLTTQDDNSENEEPWKQRPSNELEILAQSQERLLMVLARAVAKDFQDQAESESKNPKKTASSRRGA
jgi:hypothetical protein